VAVDAHWEVDLVLGQEDRQRIAAHHDAVLEHRLQARAPRSGHGRSCTFHAFVDEIPSPDDEN
jgi:hypothetical protein